VAKTSRTFPADHPLIGTWITDEEDSDTAFRFSLENNKLRVSGFCRSSGEEFEITHVKWTAWRSASSHDFRRQTPSRRTFSECDRTGEGTLN